MLLSICCVLMRLFLWLCGRLIWFVLFVMIVFELKLICVRNIFICLGVVFCVLLRMMNVWFSVWLCMYVSGVILIIWCLNILVVLLKLSRLYSVLYSGCRYGLIFCVRLLGRKLSCLLVLMVGCVSMICLIWLCLSVLIVYVIVR